MVVLLRLLTKLNVATLRLVENQINVSRLSYYSIYPTVVVLWHLFIYCTNFAGVLFLREII